MVDDLSVQLVGGGWFVTAGGPVMTVVDDLSVQLVGGGWFVTAGGPVMTVVPESAEWPVECVGTENDGGSVTAGESATARLAHNRICSW